jgi:hypothetical protein
MPTLPVTLDSALHKRFRIACIHAGTSGSKILQGFVENFVERSEATRAAPVVPPQAELPSRPETPAAKVAGRGRPKPVKGAPKAKQKTVELVLNTWKSLTPAEERIDDTETVDEDPPGFQTPQEFIDATLSTFTVIDTLTPISLPNGQQIQHAIIFKADGAVTDEDEWGNVLAEEAPELTAAEKEAAELLELGIHPDGRGVNPFRD